MFPRFTDPKRFTDPSSPLTDPRDQIEQLGRSWKLVFGVGAVSTILGILIAIDPGTSLVLLAILIGVEFVISGLFRLMRALSDRAAEDRLLWAIIGVVLMLVGVFLIRHLGVTLLFVSTLVGVFWVVVGITEIGAGLMAPAGSGRGWALVTGLIGVAAGIVVLVYPVGSLLALALVIGLWLIVKGVAQMWVAWRLREVATTTRR